MEVFQSSALINATLKEMWGKEAPSIKDTSDLVTLGRTKLFVDGQEADINKENFMKALTVRIKRTVIRTLDLNVDMPDILMNQDAYFGMLQKINVAPLLTQTDNSWNIGEDDYETTIWNINKPQVTEKFFDNLSAFTIPITIPDVMLKPAFLEGTMDGFVVAIFNSIAMSIVMVINALAHLTVSSLIAERVKAGSAVNLLEMYNTEFGTSLTATQAKYNSEFLKYAGMIMRNYISYLSNPSVLFNDGTEIRATSRDNMHVLMLNDFISAFVTYYGSNTFHNELVNLPFYKEVTYWQNMGNTVPSFATNSKIDIIPPSNLDSNNPVGVEQEGVVCVMADRQALGTTLTDDWSGIDRNNRDRYSNYTFGANRGFFLDLSENSVVFIISDNTSDTTQSGDEATKEDNVPEQENDTTQGIISKVLNNTKATKTSKATS